MSRKTESAETATTVASICLPPPSAWRAWLCSYSEKIASNDSPLSRSVLSGCQLPGEGMGVVRPEYHFPSARCLAILFPLPGHNHEVLECGTAQQAHILRFAGALCGQQPMQIVDAPHRLGRK